MVDIDDFEDIEEAVEDISDADDAISGKDIDWLVKRGIKWLSASEKDRASEERRARKEQRDEELHASAMERERMRIEKLRKEITALDEKKAIAQTQAPISVLNQPGIEAPTVLYGELPSLPQKPNLECDKNPDEFKQFLEYISTNPVSIVILGSKGYGKSALGHALLEYLHSVTGRQAVLFAPIKRKNILPQWLQIVDDWNIIPDSSVVLVDEAALVLNSRNPTAKANKSFTEINAISRQKGLALIFVSQSSRSLDINALMAGQVEVIFKNPPTFAGINERAEVRNMSKTAKKLLSKVEQAKLKEYSIVFTSGDEVMLMRNGLASYWSEDVSCLYRDVQVGTSPERDQEIKVLYGQGLTQLEIASKLGLSQSYVSRVLSGQR